MLIGVFKEVNPLQSLPRERVNSYQKVATENGYELYFFDEAGINLKSNSIKGFSCENNLWIQKEFPFPKYIINESELSIGALPLKIKKLRSSIEFNTYGIDHYSEILKRLKAKKQFDEFLPEHCYLSNTEEFINILSNHQSIIVRDIYGEVIYVINAVSENEIELNDLKETKIIPKIDLFLHMSQVIGKEKQFIAMPNVSSYSVSKTKIVVHLLTDEENEFEILTKYVLEDDKVIDFEALYKKNNVDAKFTNFLLDTLAKDLTNEINNLYKQSRREIILELALYNGKFVLYNTRSKDVNLIDEDTRSKVIFDLVKQYKLTLLTSKKVTIGMLVSTVKDSGRFRKYNNMRFACSGVAKIKGHDLFFFRSEDIDLEKKIINGFYYNKEGEYSRKKYKYPDVIIDRLRRRGQEEYQHVYDEFIDIPFNNIRDGGSLDKSDIYRIVSTSPVFKEVLIPYKDINSLGDILSFLDEHNKIILKPTVASFGDGVVSIVKRAEDNYLVRPGNIEKYDMNFDALVQFLENYLIECDGIVVQKFIESKTEQGSPFDIRIHVLKNAKAEWNIANIYPRLGKVGGVTSNLSGGGSTTSWITFFKDQFSDYEFALVNEEIRNFALLFADFFEEALQTPLNEIAIDIGIDRETVQVFLFEANVNKPGSRNHVLEAAFYIVAYAEYLAKNKLVKSKEYSI